MQKVKIYTDGACVGNPGPGGYGAVLVCGEKRKEISGGYKQTTNNRMELRACIESIKIIKSDFEIEIYTDSTYVRNGITTWVKNWKMFNWHKNKAKTKPVKNADLWQELDKLNNTRNIKWFWVKGHSGDILNERADYLAESSARKKDLKDDIEIKYQSSRQKLI